MCTVVIPDNPDEQDRELQGTPHMSSWLFALALSSVNACLFRVSKFNFATYVGNEYSFVHISTHICIYNVYIYKKRIDTYIHGHTHIIIFHHGSWLCPKHIQNTYRFGCFSTIGGLPVKIVPTCTNFFLIVYLLQFPKNPHVLSNWKKMTLQWLCPFLRIIVCICRWTYTWRTRDDTRTK